MATTLRLPPPLQARSAQFAADLGISVNALVVIALDEFLTRKAASAKAAASRLAVGAPVALVAHSKLPRKLRRQIKRNARKGGKK